MSVTVNADNQITNSSFAFDGDGNPTSYQGAAFTYDPEDRLTAIASASFSAAYDGDGLRAKKTDIGQTTYFLYDGDTPVVEEQMSGSTTTLFALNVWGADGWRARHYVGNQFYAFSFDPEGNAVSRQNSGNTLYNAYASSTFEAYGNRGGDYTPGGSHPALHQDPVRFGGQYGYYTDYGTGLLCLTHRYYDPGTGKFINRDPIGYGGGMNLYGFAGGNPVNESDPSGLDWQEAHDTIKKYRNQIIAAANQAGIQPLLLAGAVWGELYAGNVKGVHDRREELSRIAFVYQLTSNHERTNNSAKWVGGYGSTGREVGAALGIVDMTKWPSQISGGGSLFGRMNYVKYYESHPQYQLLDAGNYLHSLASRANRYSSHPGNLTQYQMGIILTEYNKGSTNSTAANARPGPNGTIFSQNLTAIQNALNGK
jgi:RHS repeat-associated protein